MKLRVEEDNAFFYPDVFVTCAESDRGQSHSKSAPVLVVEVLSPPPAPTTGRQVCCHRKLPTLREYALIDPERLSLDLFRREGDSKRWVLHPIEAGGHVEWASVGLQVPLEALYEDVPITTGPQPTRRPTRHKRLARRPVLLLPARMVFGYATR